MIVCFCFVRVWRNCLISLVWTCSGATRNFLVKILIWWLLSTFHIVQLLEHCGCSTDSFILFSLSYEQHRLLIFSINCFCVWLFILLSCETRDLCVIALILNKECVCTVFMLQELEVRGLIQKCHNVTGAVKSSQIGVEQLYIMKKPLPLPLSKHFYEKCHFVKILSYIECRVCMCYVILIPAMCYSVS